VTADAAAADDVAGKRAGLIRLALRIATKLGRAAGLLHYEDDLIGVALAGLTRALAGHDPSIGPLEPYAARWIAGEVRNAVRAEAERVATERPLEEADDGHDTHPLLRAEERAHDVVDTLLSGYVGAELRAQGEAGLIRRETWAALHGEIDRLAPEDRRLVELRYWEELTWAEVGAALGIADRTAREHDLRIRERLKDALILLDRVRPFRRGP
jgi:RNA polymerase sigma factor for flagellar operon FliA